MGSSPCGAGFEGLKQGMESSCGMVEEVRSLEGAASIAVEMLGPGPPETASRYGMELAWAY